MPGSDEIPVDPNYPMPKLLPPSCSFELHHYEFILSRALDLGFEFLTHRDYVQNGTPTQPFMLPRHDIDLSLSASLPMIRIERSLGIRSTIFVRVHAQGYNPFDLGNYALLRQYQEWGFEIGLHFDPGFLLVTQEDPVRMLEREKKVLESIVDRPIHGLVSHAPRLARHLSGLDESSLISLGFLYDGGSPSFIKDNFYLSDSNRRWRRGCPCNYLTRQRRITLLVHPYWWQPITDEKKHKTIQYLREMK